MASLESLNFDNSYLRLPENFYQQVKPTPLRDPFLIAFNAEVAQLLDLDPCEVNPPLLTKFFSGQELLPGSAPLAMKYTGHQFGVYNPELGDGRGLLLGEVVNSQNQRWDLHLKGAGKTAFSRFGDGRAVLRSSIREYLISEAMYGLGIPTTRALALVGSEELAMRDGMMEPCATVLRVTQCHIRFGHFEYFYHTRQHEDLKRLADYCLVRYFPEHLNSENPYLAMFRTVVERSATLVAKWQAYGFVHAVLNTDNMSLIGETFDYGPYSFMDEYKPGMISNHNDHQGRYAFSQQPAIVHWNLSALAQALLPLIDRDSLIPVLDSYPDLYTQAELTEFRKRLGLQSQSKEDKDLVQQLLTLFTKHSVDMNRFFRCLSSYDGSDVAIEALSELTNKTTEPSPELRKWLDLYDKRLIQEESDNSTRHHSMLEVNPRFVLRNYMAEEAIKEATEGDFTLIHNLITLLSSPMQENPDFMHYTEAPPSWAGSIFLTCSS
ncbi:YdiU family protein [Neptuniibacter sp.]|uniref:protein adenylyltransferase SelO n=1 Tax=Neptuniibacter sp. TaxID=1962643 RepID=UPI002611A6B1|nr:YdiU family protein [Neptuniibacter sp.]MCP4598809.1 YdiU family protein [Neptuniibacter sp.]